MNYTLNALRSHPELAVFLTLAIGFVIGRIRIGSFKFGNVLGTLIAGVLIGQLDIKVDPTVKSVFFSLFLFATGYKVGPQFFRGLKKNALSQVVLTVILCVTSLVTTLVAAKAARLRHRDGGRADGRCVHRIDGDRNRQRYDRPARSARGREDETEEQHPRGLCGQLPGGHRIRRLVSVGRGSTPASSRHEGGEPETGGADVGGRRSLGSGRSPGVQGMEYPCVPAGRRLGGPDCRGSRALREPGARVRGTGPARCRADRCHAGDRAASGRCRRHRGAAQSAARWKPAASERKSRTRRCSTFRWRRSTWW